MYFEDSSHRAFGEWTREKFWSQSWVTSATAEKVDVVLKTHGKYVFSSTSISAVKGANCKHVTKDWLHKQSMQFFWKLLIIKYAPNMQYVLSRAWFLFNAKIYFIYRAVAILACSRSLYFIPHRRGIPAYMNRLLLNILTKHLLSIVQATTLWDFYVCRLYSGDYWGDFDYCGS